MNLEEFAQQWLAAWGSNDPKNLRAFYTDDAFYRDPVKREGISGPELLPYFTKLLALNPNWKWQVLEVIPTAKGFCLK